MKAWEAKQIIDSLDPNTEVTLTIGRKDGTPPLSGVPFWTNVTPTWIDKYPMTPYYPKPYNDITCKTVH